MKINHALIFTAILLGVFFIFSPSQVAAFSDEPCTGLNYSCSDCLKCEQPQIGMIKTDSATQWTIKLESVTGITDDITGEPTGYYDFLYKVTSTPTSNSASGLNFVAMLIPDCCVTPKILIDIGLSEPFKEVFDPGEGENTLYFGRYVMNGFVVKGTSDSTVNWHLIANTNKLTMSTIIIKLKKGAIPFEMPVPGCTPPPPEKPDGAYISSTTYVCTNIDTKSEWPLSMSYVRLPDTGYADPESLRFFQGADCYDEEFPHGRPYDTKETHPEGLVYCTGGPESKLNECIKYDAESPGCVNYYIGATLCTYCWR